MSFHFYVFICSIATSHAKIEWNTSMGACAQAGLVHSIFIPCVQPYRTHSQSGRRPSGRYRSPSVNFLNPWIKYFSSKRARLQATSMSQTSCLFHPDFLPQVKKISTLSDRHLPEGVLFVFKTPISKKKIQKHKILLCKKSLFSLHKQNKEIPYKKS